MKSTIGLLRVLGIACFLATTARAQTNGLATRGDIDGDGFGDVMIQHKETGYAAALFMIDNQIVDAGYMGGTGFDINPMKLVGTLDLDNDGVEDLLFRYGDSDQYIWSIMIGTEIVDTDFLFDAETFSGWEVLATADFDADGFGDLLVRSKRARVMAIVYLQDFEIADIQFVGGSADYAAWNVAGAGDVDGDGFADILLEKPSTGSAGILWLADNVILDFSPIMSAASTTTIFPWRIAGITDVDGDQQAEIIMQLGDTSYYELYRATVDENGIAFSNEPLAGLTAGLGRWRVIGPR